MTEYGCYNITSGYIVKITTAGGGMMNGNAYAELELHFENEGEWENYEEANAIYYVEHGKNASRELLDETFYKFKEDEDTIILYKEDPNIEEEEDSETKEDDFENYFTIDIDGKNTLQKFKTRREVASFLTFYKYLELNEKNEVIEMDNKIDIDYHMKCGVFRETIERDTFIRGFKWNKA